MTAVLLSAWLLSCGGGSPCTLAVPATKAAATTAAHVLELKRFASNKKANACDQCSLPSPPQQQPALICSQVRGYKQHLQARVRETFRPVVSMETSRGERREHKREAAGIHGRQRRLSFPSRGAQWLALGKKKRGHGKRSKHFLRLQCLSLSHSLTV